MSSVKISFKHFSEIVGLTREMDILIEDSPIGSFALPDGNIAYRLFKDLKVAYVLKEPFRSWMIERQVSYDIKVEDIPFSERWGDVNETWDLHFNDPGAAILFKLTWSDQLL